MPTAVLMLVPDAGLRATLTQALEEAGKYEVNAVSSGGEALRIASMRDFDLAIVDMNLRGEYARNVIRGLRAGHPRLAILAIPMTNDPGSPALKGIDLQGVLPRLFASSDLVQRIEAALSRRAGAGPDLPPASAPVGVEQPVLPWLEDANKASQYLARLSLETSARAALLSRGLHLLAYAGQFGQSEAGELSRLADESWSRHGGRGALVRFVRVGQAEEDRLFYSVPVAGDVVLSMVFQAEAPIGVVRKQASQLVQALMRVPAPQPAVPVQELSDRGGERPQPTSPDEVQGDSGELVSAQLAWRRVGPEELPDLPRPGFSPTPSRVLPDPVPGSGTGAGPGRDRGGAGAVPDTRRQGNYEVGGGVQVPDHRARTSGGWQDHPVLLDGVADLDYGVETPQTLAGSYYSPNTGGLYRLHYTYVLVPRFARYRLEGELSARLEELIRHYAVVFHWRLNRLAMQPDHLVLNLTCPPTIAPDQVVRRIKQLTSERLFVEFPHLARDDTSGDFWAPGYLLIGTGGVPAPQQVMDYLAHVRREQGLAE